MNLGSEVRSDGKDRIGFYTKMGVITSAIVASACCWLPLILITLGFSAAGISGFFETLRPFFIVLTAGLLGTAFFLTYRKRANTEACCETPALKRSRKLTRRGLWILTALAMLFIAYPYYAKPLASIGNEKPNLANPTGKAFASFATAEFDIKGMTCSGCAVGIETKLNGEPGVRSATVVYEESKAKVQYDPKKITKKELLTSIESTGYRASIN